MRKIKALIMAFAVIIGLVVPSITTEAANNDFSDVSNDHWAAEDIYRFVDEEVINGYTDGTFGPDDRITRAQTAVMLARVLDLDVPAGEEVTKHFDDVKANEEAAGEIAAVSEAGIMTGKDKQFNPHESLNREQLASVLVRGFSLEADDNVDIYLDNVSEPHRDSVQQLANLGITDQLDDFRPIENGTRAHFVAMLARVIDNDSEEDLTELLKEVYENEVNLQSYEVAGNLNLGMTLPDFGEEFPEGELISEMLENIQIDVKGAYQKDPMLMEATIDVTLQLDPQTKTTFTIPMVMNDEKMWMKMPQIPGEEIPEELKDKFIEIDFAEFQGQETPDMDIQLEFAQIVQGIFVDHFAENYYSKVSVDDYDVPENLGVEKVIKFNLNDEELESFMKTLLTGFLPELFDIMEEPKYANAIGVTVEEIQEARTEFEAVLGDIDEMIAMLDEVLQINTFEEYIGINKDNVIVSDDFNLDFDLNVEDEAFGITLEGNQTKENINGDVSIELPSEEDIVTLEDIMEIVEEEIEEIQ